MHFSTSVQAHPARAHPSTVLAFLRIAIRTDGRRNFRIVVGGDARTMKTCNLNLIMHCRVKASTVLSVGIVRI
eukprot:scaffold683_cov124-Cylindrotheca_fusiformis.AAC.32